MPSTKVTGELGMQFQEEIELLLERHLLSGLTEAPWVRTVDAKSLDDDRFFAALKSLWPTLLRKVPHQEERTPLSSLARDASQVIYRNSAGGAVLLQKYRSELIRLSPFSVEEIPRDMLISLVQNRLISRTIPNPVVLPKPTPNPKEPAPKEPVRTPEKVP